MTRDRVLTISELMACPLEHDSTPGESEPQAEDACSVGQASVLLSELKSNHAIMLIGLTPP